MALPYSSGRLRQHGCVNARWNRGLHAVMLTDRLHGHTSGLVCEIPNVLVCVESSPKSNDDGIVTDSGRPS